MTKFKRNDYVTPANFDRGNNEGGSPDQLCRIMGQSEDTQRGPYLRTLMRWFGHDGAENWSEFWFYEDELELVNPPESEPDLPEGPEQLSLWGDA